MRMVLRIIACLGILLASNTAYAQSYDISLRVVQVGHNYECSKDDCSFCVSFNSKPEPRYRVRARYGTSTSPGSYTGTKLIDPGDNVSCGSYTRSDAILSVLAVSADQLQVEVDMWEDDCGADSYYSSCDENRTQTSPVYLLSSFSLGTSTFTITGSGGYFVKLEVSLAGLPDIELKQGDSIIVDGDSTPDASDSTDYGTINVSTETTTVAYAIKNNGRTDLALSGSPLVSINGANAADFKVVSQPQSSTIAAGDSTIFRIQFDPSKTGLRTAQVSIASDDVDEDPYVFDIQGKGYTPCTSVQIIQAGNSTSTSSNNTITPYTNFFEDGRSQFLVLASEFTGLSACTDSLFGMAFNVATAVAQSSNVTIGIKTANTTSFSSSVFETGFTQVFSGTHSPSKGWDMIDFDRGFSWNGNDNLIIEICYDNAAFTGNSSVEYSSLSFTANRYAYTDASNGCNLSSLGSNSNRPNIRFRFGAQSEIKVSGNHKEIVDGDVSPSTSDSTSFGSQTLGSNATIAYTIENIGSASLNLNGSPLISFSGTNSADFSVARMPKSTISAGDSSIFRITFSPKGEGARSATVSIANDDSDENPYTFDLSGTGTCNISLAATPSHVSCNSEADGKVNLNISGGAAPYTDGVSVFQDGLTGTLNKTIYDSLNMEVLQTSAGLRLKPTSSSAIFLGKEKFKFQPGLTFEGSVFLPDSGYRVIMVGLNDGSSTTSNSVSKGIYFSEFRKTGSISVYAINNGTGSKFPSSTYNTSSTGDWYDIKIAIGNGEAIYYIKKSTESGFTNTKTVSFSSSPDSLQIGVYASKTLKIPLTGFSLHKNWNVYYENPDTANLAPGSFTYYVTDAYGCSTSVTTSITEPILLTAAAVVDSNASCNGFANGGASVSASGGTTPYTYLWSNASKTPAISGVTAGVYTVTVTDANNCRVTKSVTITQPTALSTTITVDSNVTCYGYANGGTSISVSGGATPYAYLWSNKRTGTSIAGIGSGKYTVTVTDGNDCTTSKSSIITEPKPFSISTNVDSHVTCFGLSNGKASVIANGVGNTYAWSNSATTSSISRLATGTYYVTATNSLGCTSRDSAIIKQPDTLILTTVVDSNVSCLGLANGGATASTAGGTTPYIYRWNNTATTASIVGINAGIYTVVVRDANNCTATKFATIAAPTMSIGGLNPGSKICEGDIPQKITERSPTSGSGGNYVYTWQDSIAGGNWTDITRVSSKDYQPIAIKQSTWYRRIDSALVGCVVDTTQSIRIGVSPQPKADFEFSTACEDEQVQFIDSSSVKRANIGSYNWSFGNVSTSTQRNPTNVYKNTGSYTVLLIVTTDSACIDTVSKTVEISPVPSTGFKVANICANDSATFSNTSLVSSGSNTYNWDFGDSTFSAQKNPKHQFGQSGFYTVALTTITDKGCQSSKTATLQVYELPTSAFTAADVCDRDSMSFTNESRGAGRYSWNFGDRLNSVGSAPKHIYASDGNYQVSLIATSTNGCVDTLEKQVTVHALPNAVFSASIACLTDTTEFTNTTKGASSYTWDLGDGSSSILATPSLVYGKSGSFNVRLIASSTQGCKDTVTNAIAVNAIPIISFSANDTCNGKAVVTSNNTTGANSYRWSYGDGNGATSTSPSHTYSSDGSYNLQLVATSSKGCQDSAIKTVAIYPLPQVSFSQSDICDGVSMSFSNSSSISSGVNSYAWSLGDGNTSKNTSPSHNYASDGNFTVQLIATSGNGCQDSASKAVTVNALPKPLFSVKNECLSDTFRFANKTTGAISQIWRFGDATGSNALAPKHIYNTASFYTVTLIATSSNNCVDSLSRKVQAYPMPAAQFTFGNVCDNDSMSFSNGSQGASTYAWNFGDRSNSMASIPKHVYSGDGNYQVSLIATSTDGCADTLEKQVTVHALPVAVFSAGEECLTDTTMFTNSSIGANTYSWDLGNGSSSSLETPNHLYGKSGKYDVVLVATSNENCKDTVAHTVSVNSLPSVSFKLNDACDGKAVTMVNQTSGATSYQWSFGDRKGSNSTSPSYTYSTDGSYSVQLVATSSKGCKDSAIKTVAIYPLPQVSFSQSNVCDGVSMSFSNSSSISSGVNSYAWNLGDGNTSKNTSPSHNYATDGNFTVQLIATSGNGCQDSTSKTVTVHTLPKPAFSVKNECLSDTFRFTNKTTGATSQIWSFGDATTSIKSTPEHVYGISGFYTVTLIASSKNNCVDSFSRKTQVYPTPTAQFSFSNVCDKDGMSFSNGSLGASKYTWNFGDRSNSVASTPRHVYLGSGNYQVSLIATSTNGCVDTLEKQVTVHALPLAAFSVSEECLTDTTMFINSSTGANTYSWDLGNGTSSSLETPNHLYGKSGKYDVVLVATSNENCKDTVAHTVSVNSLPSVSFRSANTCDGKAVAMVNQTTGAASYQWAFGDGNMSTSTSPNYTYKADGSYQIKLIGTTVSGCMDSLVSPIEIYPLPQMSFSQSNVCDGLSMSFSNSSAISSGTNKYSWNFGDLNTSNNTSPLYKYSSNGNYNVQLIATSGKGCQDSLSKTVTVYPLPKPVFSVNNECLSDELSFNNTSTGAIGYSWGFGDATSSIQTTPSHKYATSGYYTVSLTAATNKGCVDSILKKVQVFEMPTASFTFSDVCDKDTVHFVNNSQKAAASNWSFGNKAQSVLSSPNYVYGTAGTYRAQLIVATTKGCRDTLEKRVNIFTLPVAAFVTKDVCFTDSTEFTNASKGGSSYAWNLGDGSSSALANPKKLYGKDGVYRAHLTITSNEGCSDTLSQPITVNPLPQVVFSANDTCDGKSVSIVNSTAGASKYAWTYGDGNGSIATSPTYTYASDGLYRVKLIAATVLGCQDSSTALVSVFPLPAVSYTQSNVCYGTAMTFTNSSSVSTGINTYNWNFGDGIESKNGSPTHLYKTNGAYNVKLIAITDRGCQDSINQSVQVYEQPIAGFATNDECYGDTTFFTNTTAIASSTDWSFGDGRTSGSASPFNLYSKDGSYLVKLVTSTANCVDSISQPISIFKKPIAGFIHDSVCDGNSILFTNTSFYGEINGYDWNFGDKALSTLANPQHLYYGSGSYHVALVVTTDKGCKDTVTSVAVTHPNPMVRFSSTNVCAYDTMRFTNTSSISTGNIKSQEWKFGDGANTNTTTASRFYEKPGNYQVSLAATSDQGCTSSFDSLMEVYVLPTALFTVDDHCYGLSTDFNNLSRLSVGTLDQFAWDFGDTETSTDEIPYHFYEAAGSYDIQLVVSSNNGCVDTLIRPIEVYEKPEASFTAAAVCQRQITQFGNTSTNWTEASWNFGDDEGFSGLENPNYQYLNAGLYNVRLQVLSKNGCRDTLIQPVEVYGLPTANFSVLSQCFGEDVLPINSSLGDIASWNWSFGDGASATSETPTYQYAKDGEYIIGLLTTDDNGCVDSVKRKVIVHPLPVLGIHNDTLVSKGYEVKLWASGGVDYAWSPTLDLKGSNSESPTVTVVEDVTYNVTVSTIYGCAKDTFVNVRVEDDYTMEPSNVLTPDGNGQNDYWVVEKATYYDDIEVVVFDRWGRVVYQASPYLNNWDGTVNGKPLPDGAYYYIIKVPHERESYKGSLTIFR